MLKGIFKTKIKN